MWADILTILTLFVLEVMLSCDNAAVLAIMVKDLPGDQGKKALKYGLLGAYLLRGSCLFIAGWLVHLWWLKIVGGLYLLYLTYKFFTTGSENGDIKVIKPSSFLKTIILVEIADLTFSLDNIFAAVAMSPKLWIVITSVFMGILAMRFVAGGFVNLMKKYPFLDKSAFIVIGLLGIKLILGGLAQGCSWVYINNLMSKHTTDFVFSICLLFIFFIPLIIQRVQVIREKKGK